MSMHQLVTPFDPPVTDKDVTYQLVPSEATEINLMQKYNPELYNLGGVSTKSGPTTMRRQSVLERHEKYFEVWHEETVSPDLRHRLQNMLQGLVFQVAMGCLIVGNAIFIGVATDSPDRPEWTWVDKIFLVVFTGELLARLTAYGPVTFFSPRGPDFVWNMLDLFIVTIGVFDDLSLAMKTRPEGGKHEHSGTMSTLFRMFRLLRILRIFKIIRFLKQLYLLAYGFVEAATAVAWVSCLMLFVLYICGIVLTRTLGALPHDDPNYTFMHGKFGTVPVSMFTLFKIMAQPQLDEYDPIMSQYPFFSAFLIVFVIFGSFGMIALLTGVISESMFEKNQLRIDSERVEKEARRKVLLGRCSELFDTLTLDEDEEVKPEDLIHLLPEVAKVLDDMQATYEQHDLDSIIDLMDCDESGSVSKPEFLHGILSMAEDIRPKTLKELHHLTSTVRAKVHICQQTVRKVALQNEISKEERLFIAESLTTMKAEFDDHRKQVASVKRDSIEAHKQFDADYRLMRQAMGVAHLDLGAHAADHLSEAHITSKMPHPSGILEASSMTGENESFESNRSALSDVTGKLTSFESVLHQSQKATREMRDRIESLSACVGNLLLQIHSDRSSFGAAGKEKRESSSDTAECPGSPVKLPTTLLQGPHTKAQAHVQLQESHRQDTGLDKLSSHDATLASINAPFGHVPGSLLDRIYEVVESQHRIEELLDPLRVMDIGRRAVTLSKVAAMASTSKLPPASSSGSRFPPQDRIFHSAPMFPSGSCRTPSPPPDFKGLKVAAVAPMDWTQFAV